MIPMILKSSENQPSRMYKSNLSQTWPPMFPFEFLKGSYLELIKLLRTFYRWRNAIFNRCFHRELLWKKNFGKDKNYLKELQNSPVINDTSEDISQIFKLPWIPIIGPKLRQAFKKKSIKTIFTSGPNLKSLLCRNKTSFYPTVIQEYIN